MKKACIIFLAISLCVTNGAYGMFGPGIRKAAQDTLLRLRTPGSAILRGPAVRELHTTRPTLAPKKVKAQPVQPQPQSRWSRYGRPLAYGTLGAGLMGAGAQFKRYHEPLVTSGPFGAETYAEYLRKKALQTLGLEERQYADYLQDLGIAYQQLLQTEYGAITRQTPTANPDSIALTILNYQNPDLDTEEQRKIKRDLLDLHKKRTGYIPDSGLFQAMFSNLTNEGVETLLMRINEGKINLSNLFNNFYPETHVFETKNAPLEKFLTTVFMQDPEILIRPGTITGISFKEGVENKIETLKNKLNETPQSAVQAVQYLERALASQEELLDVVNTLEGAREIRVLQEQDKLELEDLEQKRLERLEQERLEQERLEQERLAREQLKREEIHEAATAKREQARAEKEQTEQEKRESQPTYWERLKNWNWNWW